VPQHQKARRGGDPRQDITLEEADVLVDLRWIHADPGDHERRAHFRRRRDLLDELLEAFDRELAADDVEALLA